LARDLTGNARQGASASNPARSSARRLGRPPVERREERALAAAMGDVEPDDGTQAAGSFDAPPCLPDPDEVARCG
jgi:hypothetical protein